MTGVWDCGLSDVPPQAGMRLMPIAIARETEIRLSFTRVIIHAHVSSIEGSDMRKETKLSADLYRRRV